MGKRHDRIRKLLAKHRITFGDCVGAFSEEGDARRDKIIEMARERHQEDGEVEIDSNAVLSEGDDNGTYVMAWVWVDFGGTQFDKDSPSSGDNTGQPAGERSAMA